MKFFKSHKRAMIASLALTVALLGGGAAYAFYSSTGNGVGAAQTATSQNVTITQIGAGYNSLTASNTYSQDQCFSCSSIIELGNDVTLANPDASQLVNTVVAVDNWGGPVTVPMTFTINNTVAGPISDTQYFSFPAAVSSEVPSVTNATFDFSSQGAFVDPEFVYGITFNLAADEAPVAQAGSLNIALSSSATDLSVGTDTSAGSIWLDGGYAGDNDFPTCTVGLPTSGFSKVLTNCGPWNPADPGAYGNEAVTNDIPAVQVNVVGGVTTGLYPGDTQPVLYAITNAGSSPVEVNSVSASVDNNATDVENPSSAPISGCLVGWFAINNSPESLLTSVPPGTTLITGSDLSITMTNPAVSQNSCEGKDIGLSFTSN